MRKNYQTSRLHQTEVEWVLLWTWDPEHKNSIWKSVELKICPSGYQMFSCKLLQRINTSRESRHIKSQRRARVRSSYLVPFDKLAPPFEHLMDRHRFELQRVYSRFRPGHDCWIDGWRRLCFSVWSIWPLVYTEPEPRTRTRTRTRASSPAGSAHANATVTHSRASAV